MLSFVHAFIRSCIHSFIHAFVHACIHSLMHSFVHAFIRSFMHSFMHAFIHSCIHSFMHSFIHAFVRSPLGVQYLDASVPDVAALLSTSNSTETEGAVDEVKIGGFQVTQGIPRPRRDEEEGEAKTAQKVEEASDKKEVRTGAVKKSTETAQPLTSRTANYTGSVLTTIQTFIRKRIQALK